MIRAFLYHFIPFILPFVVYAVYLYFNARAGGEKSWEKKSLAAVTLVGLILTAASFIALGFVNGEPREGTVYIPPRFENGKIIDSQVVPADQVKTPEGAKD
ncbi:MAG: hypothetical protein EP348_03950 [Alphaproteobacteria bacterium]|nr:MAG: hypothetical protein EP348_03950 [Alphaproteobacteria bacterium]